MSIQCIVVGIQGMNSLVNCGVISLPTNGDGYCGALYILVRLLFLTYSNMETNNAQKKIVPSTAPTIAATGECVWLAETGVLPDGVAVANALCVTVLNKWSAELNVVSESSDGGDAVVELDGNPVAVIVTITTDVIGARDGSEDFSEAILISFYYHGTHCLNLHRPGVRSLLTGQVLPGIHGSIVQQPRKPLHI
jgi:hypothetical protein